MKKQQYELEHWVVESIKLNTKKGNLDNISRTLFYESYYRRNHEIKWAFLAGMVSRNAGWCMMDLALPPFRSLIKEKTRKNLFMAYEASNWLIFSDAWPQLALYEASKKFGLPLFHLLEKFGISSFMQEEWQRFWQSGDKERLMTALIINEQHLIQKPVVKNIVFKKTVFGTLLFRMQDMMHFSTVLFPALDGRIFGFTAYDFKRLEERISLGKRLAWLLFHEEYHLLFSAFSKKAVPTGSRYDYEKFSGKIHHKNTPILRAVYPIITHNIGSSQRDWYRGQRLEHFFPSPAVPDAYEVSGWYEKKQNQLLGMALLKEYFYSQHKK
ncbi:DUF2515 domain-containing protein [Metabacillus sp. GX 13764]|uniref:DUF2515 family protein n=1 Tax=Metabacillus kandeliae TaxID=2900151 RepID=UPI001E282587|nr:DUF2515 family protein [Metabacillus kandeliae]MCD7033406.1 DUF2515 domain-containing protein [Metabacillus kandeliae]